MTNSVAFPIPEEELQALCVRHHVARLSVFGSAVRDDFTPASDIDLLVEFEPGKTPGLAFFGLQEELATLLGREVDLVTIRGLNKYIRERVLSEARTIYDAA